MSGTPRGSSPRSTSAATCARASKHHASKHDAKPVVSEVRSAMARPLAQAQADRLTDYAKSGKPLLLLLDPMPAFDLELAPQDIAQEQSPFGSEAPPPTPKANLRPLLDAAGVTRSEEHT